MSDIELESIVSRLHGASDEDVEAIGPDALASFLHGASPAQVDEIVKLARRHNVVRQCLSAARYYSGLKQGTCDKIDSVLQAPFPAARRQ